MPVELEELLVPDAGSLRRWLEGDPELGVWLTLARKGVDAPTTLTYAQAVDEALCFGWIDGQARKRDDSTFFVRFTPRRARSVWSKRNVEHVARLVDEGRMHARGLAEVERAKADGRWERAYAGPAGMEVPPDLAAALAAAPAASAAFDALGGQERYAILYHLHQLKTEAIRTRRLEEYVAKLAAEGEA